MARVRTCLLHAPLFQSPVSLTIYVYRQHVLYLSLFLSRYFSAFLLFRAFLRHRRMMLSPHSLRLQLRPNHLKAPYDVGALAIEMPLLPPLSALTVLRLFLSGFSVVNCIRVSNTMLTHAAILPIICRSGCSIQFFTSVKEIFFSFFLFGTWHGFLLQTMNLFCRKTSASN